MAWETAIIVGHLGIIGAFLYSCFSIDKEHFFVKILFFFLSFIGVSVLVAQMWFVDNYQTTIPTSSSNVVTMTLYVVSVVFLITFLYYLIWFFIKWYQHLLEKNGL